MEATYNYFQLFNSKLSLEIYWILVNLLKIERQVKNNVQGKPVANKGNNNFNHSPSMFYQQQSRDALLQNNQNARIINEYLILSKLGSGSFGVIYKVRRKSDNGIYVMKEIEIEDDSNFKNSLQEMNLLKSLSHQHIVKYVDSFTREQNFYIIMEYCEKGDLCEYISRFGVNLDIPEGRIWKIIIQMLLALEYIHNNGIIHSDLKPQNILLTGKDQDIRLADFGISQILTKNYLYSHSQVGTLYYCSPEMCKGLAFNQKTDIWALGQILWGYCGNLQFVHEQRSRKLTLCKAATQPLDHQSKSQNAEYLYWQTLGPQHNSIRLGFGTMLNKSERRGESKKMNDSKLIIENQKQERRNIMINNVQQAYFQKQQNNNQEFYKDILKKRKYQRVDIDRLSPIKSAHLPNNEVKNSQSSLLKLINNKYQMSSMALNKERDLRFKATTILQSQNLHHQQKQFQEFLNEQVIDNKPLQSDAIINSGQPTQTNNSRINNKFSLRQRQGALQAEEDSKTHRENDRDFNMVNQNNYTNIELRNLANKSSKLGNNIVIQPHLSGETTPSQYVSMNQPKMKLYLRKMNQSRQSNVLRSENNSPSSNYRRELLRALSKQKIVSQ
eukprot:403366059